MEGFEQWVYEQLQLLSRRVGHPLPPAPWGTDTGARSYTVQPGDTLGQLAQQYLHDGAKWSQIEVADELVIGPTDEQGHVQPKGPQSQLRAGAVINLPDPEAS